MAENIMSYNTSFTTPIIANNAVYILSNIPKSGQIYIIVKDSSVTADIVDYIMFSYSLNPSLGGLQSSTKSNGFGNMDLAATGTILNGTTGSNANATFSVRFDGSMYLLYLENRLGNNIIFAIGIVSISN